MNKATIKCIDISYALDGTSHTVGRHAQRAGAGRSHRVDTEHDNLCILYCGNGQS